MTDKDMEAIAGTFADIFHKKLHERECEAGKSKKFNGPWWSKSMVVLGPLAVIALLLVAQAVGLLNSPLREDHTRIEMEQESQTYLLRAICQNTAGTDYAAEKCNPLPSGYNP